MRDALIVTNHAKTRMQQQNISPAMVDMAWHQGGEYQLPLWHYFKKLCKYQHQKTVRYYKYGRLLLTVNHTNNGPILITVTRRCL